MENNPKLKLELTERAYYAILDQTIKHELFDPLPVLRYNADSDSFEIGAMTSKDVDKLKVIYNQNNQQLVYQVGRINICIEEQELVEKVTGMLLDYLEGDFILKKQEKLDNINSNRKLPFWKKNIVVYVISG